MIYLIGIAPESEKYKPGTWEEFTKWAMALDEFELDIETDVTPYWCNKTIITIQLGFEDTHWVLQVSQLNEEQIQWLKDYLGNASRLKLIHHAQFEYIVLRFWGVEISNVFDTMVVEKILTGGIENANYSLSDLSEKYLNSTLDKSEQTTFGDDILTENKVLYAAKDVQILSSIRTKQMPEITKWNLGALLDLENKVVLTLGEMTYHGMTLDQVKWAENEEWVKPFIEKSLINLNSWLLKDPHLKAKAIELKYLSTEDMLYWNLNAPGQKREFLGLLYPDIPGATKPILKKYIRDNKELGVDDIMLLQDVQVKDYGRLETILLRDHREYLIQHGYLLPAGEINLNWNSIKQALELLKAVEPRLKSLSDKDLSKATHPVFEDLSDYKDNLKLVDTYGMTFIDKHLEPDGKIRTQYNQIVSTGRLSSKKPNMQNIPAKEGIGTRYRNAFICNPDWVYVDSDYVSAELVIIAYISNEDVWNEALKKNWDLHSVCAELVFGKDWVQSANEDCTYYKIVNGQQLKQKCKCSRHKTMRTSVKVVSFGLCYGMSALGLSLKLKISMNEATALMNKYFKAFPKIAGVLKYLSEFGIKYGYSKTPAPFFRKRWYPFWKFSEYRIPYHLSGVQKDPNLAAIGRQSSNHPIQGCNADVTKLALVKIYEWIRENGYQDRIHIVAQIHDQVTTICHKDVSEMWKVKMDELMCIAAKMVLPSGLLKAETCISDCWTK